MSESALRFATDELERANDEAEMKRLAWLVARVAHPSTLDVDAAIEYAEAANAAHETHQRFLVAQAEAQAEWVSADGLRSLSPPPPGEHLNGQVRLTANFWNNGRSRED